MIECRYPDGRLVREHALVWFRDGRIARWAGVQAWDEAPAPFAATVFADITATMTTVLAALGDRLGLFRSLARDGAASSAELAERAAVSERYTREWLHGMTAAGYLERAGERFALPASHADVLAAEDGPSGAYEALTGELAMLDQIAEAFVSGSGVALAAYPPATFAGQRRVSLPWYRHELVQQWIPAAGLHERLAAGACVADVGCGSGEALIALATAYPRSTFTGFDSFAPVLERARAAAQAAQVNDRVQFELLDAADGLPDTYDVDHRLRRPPRRRRSRRAPARDRPRAAPRGDVPAPRAQLRRRPRRERRPARHAALRHQPPLLPADLTAQRQPRPRHLRLPTGARARALHAGRVRARRARGDRESHERALRGASPGDARPLTCGARKDADARVVAPGAQAAGGADGEVADPSVIAPWRRRVRRSSKVRVWCDGMVPAVKQAVRPDIRAPRADA